MSETSMSSVRSMRRHVSDFHRASILRAMAEIAGDEGLEAATVARVTARAGCSRRTFYELFADRTDCYLAALERAVERARASARPAFDAENRWIDELRAGVHALLEFFDAEPELARLCFLASTAGDRASLRFRQRVIRDLARLVDGGRAAGRLKPPELIAEAVVGGCFVIVQARVARGEALGELLGPLMAVIVCPYLGGARSREELARGLRVAASRRERRAPVENLVTPPKRLTRRTLMTLAAIAAQPGMSNRAVSERSGIVDQGQISKLLQRLQGLGLIGNLGTRRGGRETNSWEITEAGAALVRAFAAEL